VKSTHITTIRSCQIDEKNIAATMDLAKEATRFDGWVPPDRAEIQAVEGVTYARRSSNPAGRGADCDRFSMEGIYGKGSIVRRVKCLDLTISAIFRTSTN
jgi:hypothetical protein